MHPQTKIFLEALAQSRAGGWESLPLEEARKRFASMRPLFGCGPELANVEDLQVDHGVGLRVYRPSLDPMLPCLVFYHGGGWVLGDLDTHDALCRQVCHHAHAIVVSVDYRKAPEFPYPIPLNDACQALNYLYRQSKDLGIDSSRIAVGGDSAGGNLAAAVAIRSTALGMPKLHSQWLLYPVTDSALDSSSCEAYAEGFGLRRSTMQWFWDQYAPNSAMRNDPLLSPVKLRQVQGLPAATFYLAELDILHDEASAYAHHLMQGGVRVKVNTYPGVPHGFMHFAGHFDDGKAALRRWGQELKIAFMSP